MRLFHRHRWTEWMEIPVQGTTRDGWRHWFVHERRCKKCGDAQSLEPLGKPPGFSRW